jgi:predicted RNA methylase
MLIISCKPTGKSSNTNQGIQSDLKQSGRDTWQKPELVIDILGDLTEKTVADIGAGTGYFTFRMAFKAKKVIAVEIDPQMIDLIEVFQQNLPQQLEGKVEARLVEADNPGLKQGEVDVAVIINTIAYIDNPIQYLSTLKQQLNEGGYLMIVDFKKTYLPIDAPPMSERLSIEEVENILSESGWTDVIANRSSLEYQYIITAYK